MENTCNGWKNWHTWVANLWIDNTEENYKKRNRYFAHCHRFGEKPTYTGLINWTRLENTDISWDNKKICRKEITADLQEDYTIWVADNFGEA